MMKSEGVRIRIFPFSVEIKSSVRGFALAVNRMYADFELLGQHEFIDFHVELQYVPGISRLTSPKIRFCLDGRPSFTELPAEQVFPSFEWGLNWCVASHAHQFLIIHAAVIERHGVAIVMPAPPGSGKSTLCAGLICRGWRLLSDELALYDIASGQIVGMPRPVSLKGQSVEVIRRFESSSIISEPVMTESKGWVSLMKPPSESVTRSAEPATAKWVVLPKYQEGSATRLEPYNSVKAFLTMAEQSFNYDLHGEQGFLALGKLLDGCQCRQFTYSDLDEAVTVFETLANT